MWKRRETIILPKILNKTSILIVLAKKVLQKCDTFFCLYQFFYYICSMRKVKTKEWEKIYTGQYRKKRVLSIFPFIVMDGIKSDFHWTGKWFKFITVKQQKVKERHLHFNEWDGSRYWGKWETRWVITKIMKNEKIN